MHILLVNNSKIPALKYGGTERVIWWLGKALVKMGHKVSYLVAPGSTCPFADVYEWQPALPFNSQVPAGVDVLHLSAAPNEPPIKPYLITMHGNINFPALLDQQTVFVSRNHASRFGSDCFVHNCIDPEDYGIPNLTNKRDYVHFLADAAWRVKNVRGAIRIARMASVPLQVIGGVRFNFNMGIRLTFDTNVTFQGMKGGTEKNQLINGSRALLFPVLWHEPFGLAVIESLYFGCPVFGTPYGSLPELIPAGMGVLSANKTILAEAVKHANDYDRSRCHQYAADTFSPAIMTRKYLGYYEKVMNGEKLNASPPQLVQVQPEKFLPFT